MTSAQQAEDVSNQRPIGGTLAKIRQDWIAFPEGTLRDPVISPVEQANEKLSSFARIFQVQVFRRHRCSLQRLKMVMPLIGVRASPPDTCHQMTVQTSVLAACFATTII